MVTIDGRKIQEIKEHYQEMAKKEIDGARNDPETKELKEDDIQAIESKYQFKANSKITELKKLGPEKLFKLGYAHDLSGWRSGYTKPTIEARKEKNRAKNKLSRKARRSQNKK